MTGNVLLKLVLRILVHIPRFVIRTRHWSVVKFEGSLARLAAQFTTARSGYHLLSYKNERTVPILNVIWPLLQSWMAWSKWSIVIRIECILSSFSDRVFSLSQRSWRTKAYPVSRVACRPKPPNRNGIDEHPTPTGVDGERITLLNNKHLHLYTPVWLGWKPSSGGEQPVAGDQPTRSEISYLF